MEDLVDDVDAGDPTAFDGPEVAGAVSAPTVTSLPDGFVYGVTRYADVILKEAFPRHFDEIVSALGGFSAQLAELQQGGGNRTPFVRRFDDSLGVRGWGKKNIEIGKTIDGVPITKVRGHEIDMFRLGEDGGYPGVAVEMEWSNKDPFFDRDLLNYQALHREGVLAVGVIVTRGPELQRLIKPIIRNPKGEEKYGESTTHWNKLVPRVNLGGGGECPLLLVGIEPPRIDGIHVVLEVQAELGRLADLHKSWRNHYGSFAEAQRDMTARKSAALSLLPAPVSDEG